MNHLADYLNVVLEIVDRNLVSMDTMVGQLPRELCNTDNSAQGRKRAEQNDKYTSSNNVSESLDLCQL